MDCADLHASVTSARCASRSRDRRQRLQASVPPWPSAGSPRCATRRCPSRDRPGRRQRRATAARGARGRPRAAERRIHGMSPPLPTPVAGGGGILRRHRQADFSLEANGAEIAIVGALRCTHQSNPPRPRTSPDVARPPSQPCTPGRTVRTGQIETSRGPNLGGRSSRRDRASHARRHAAQRCSTAMCGELVMGTCCDPVGSDPSMLCCGSRAWWMCTRSCGSTWPAGQ